MKSGWGALGRAGEKWWKPVSIIYSARFHAQKPEARRGRGGIVGGTCPGCTRVSYTYEKGFVIVKCMLVSSPLASLPKYPLQKLARHGYSRV